ncbi:hypothetical protein JOF56_009691 [Kibdelosporangium banguiense]|uniref:Uncharacterized protein n=1 Tax=Kibdelosporangium banguiense TaxID=1365924 RepID=A0ABS4TZG4_9PSEU|nr:hypothetical protein [Kibdelosporangium banguiense]MBP2329306.1 hypothetical protein [Kibdelosporangium banguiense]
MAVSGMVVAVEPALAAGPCSVSLTTAAPGGHVAKASCYKPNTFIARAEAKSNIGGLTC